MTTINPYESPISNLDEESSPSQSDTRIIILDSTSGTFVPRYIAASADNLVAMVLGVVAAKMLPDTFPIMQFTAAIAVFLGYFFISEWLFSRTPGKFITGLVVLQKDGSRIIAKQAVIRTIFRFVEVNPFLLGALPAAICIFFSKRRQRLGDMVAGTVVVPVSQMRTHKGVEDT
jgi:uncharacterized RDD family membrane protein YckC